MSVQPGSRRRIVRWAVTAGILVIALVVPASGRLLTANASPRLPSRTAAQLLTDVQTARVDALSGTVVQHSDLGLPELPGMGPSGSSSLTSLVAGTHTMRLWYSGPDKARMALLGTLGESDVIVNGRDVWVWSSAQRTAQHRRLPAPETSARENSARARELPQTPAEATRRALAAVGPTTTVSTGDTVTVAGRSAYELVLAPRDTRSLVREVRIAVDSATKAPLRFRAFAVGQRAPAFEVGFTQVAFDRPGAEHFRFVPPPGTTVTEARADARVPEADHAAAARVVGTGWTSVVVAKAPSLGGSADVEQILAALRPVHGSWGSGRLLRSSLFSVLLTDDGRVAAGAVTPDQLYAAVR
jgi:outer membrane lipoprotein-sorting protein